MATPGRLIDHMRFPYARLASLEVLVLDEADRMLDMGFLPDIRKILHRIPKDRQSMLFSATMPAEIVGLSREILRNPAAINLERKAAPAVGITQAVYPVGRELKPALLIELLRRDVISEAIVFTRTKHRANRLADAVERSGISASRIHGNRSQNQRVQALEGFKSGRCRVLVATDIVARGIDVEDLSHVVNFDVPADPDAYIHRVGRTARAEATGDAFTFVSPDEEDDLKAIERVLGKRLPRVTLPGFDYAKKPEGRLEIPIRERLAAARAARGAGRGRGKPKAAQRGPRSGARRGGGGGRTGGGRSRVDAILDRHAPVKKDRR
jgi:ATP-dependent RNA helicase RhlE